jgi:ABC-type transport system involved in cytochrome c biogenesis permease subunit
MLAVALYGVSTMHWVFLWRKGFRRDTHVNYLLLLGAFCFHTAAMLTRGLRLNHCPVSNPYEVTVFVMWTIVAAYLVVGLWSRLRFLGAFASPWLFAMGVFALIYRRLDISHGARPELPLVWTSLRASSVVWTSLHASFMALSYGAFGLSAVAALMYLSQERNLKMHRLKALFALMPPIQRLEAVVNWLLVSGFVLLTLGLGMGVFGMAHLKDPHAYAGDLTILCSVPVWVLYLGLVIMRWRFAQGGRRFALAAVGAFVFVLLTFCGTKVLSAYHSNVLPALHNL